MRKDLTDYRGPRIIINPSTFRNEKDAACVMWNECFRIVMEDMGFEPVSEPTDEQRKFFSDTAYANDERQMRRTILARICTFDTSVRRPTDEQLQEAIEFLEDVMEAGYPQNEWEQSAVQRMHDMISQVPMGQQEEQPPEEQPPEEQPPEEQPPEEQADMLGGETFDDKVKLAGVRAPGTGRPEDVDAAEEAAHDELLAQREAESEGEANKAPAQAAPAQAAPAQAAPAQAAPVEQSFVQLPAFASLDDPNQSTFRAVPGAPAQMAPVGQSFVQLPAFAGSGGTNQGLREVLNTPMDGTPAGAEKKPGTPGAWQGGRYGVKKGESGLPNSWKGRRY